MLAPSSVEASMQRLITLTVVIFTMAAMADDNHFTSICEEIGQSKIVSITIDPGGPNEEVISQEMIVGDENDRCPGRCGPSCSGSPSAMHGSQVYTQECLEHDLCEHVKGSWFGPCKKLALKAKDSFFHAPNCN